MAKITGALLSLGAEGTLADTLVYSQWRGVPYVRRHVTPANPNSTGQQTTRNTFTTLNDMWKVAPALLRAPWDRYAAGRPFLPRNAFVGQNLAANRGAADFTAFIGSPGASGGFPPDSITVTPASNQLTIDFTTPAPPTGWTLASAIAIAFEDQDPAAAWAGVITAGEDTSTMNQVVLSGLTATTLYIVSAWLEWTKPSGRTAYSPAIADSGTPTV